MYTKRERVLAGVAVLLITVVCFYRGMQEGEKKTQQTNVQQSQASAIQRAVDLREGLAERREELHSYSIDNLGYGDAQIEKDFLLRLKSNKKLAGAFLKLSVLGLLYI